MVATKLAGETRAVGPRGLQALDFNQIALKLGAKTKYCEGRWTELDEEDFRVLYALLTKDVLGCGSAAASSESLKVLAAFCATAIQWFNAQKDVCVIDTKRSA